MLIIQNDVRQQIQPYRYRRGHHQPERQNPSSHSHRSERRKLRTAKDSIVLLEQVRTLDKRRLKEKMGELPKNAMASVDSALSISFGLGSRTPFGTT